MPWEIRKLINTKKKNLHTIPLIPPINKGRLPRLSTFTTAIPVIRNFGKGMHGYDIVKRTKVSMHYLLLFNT
jgi:hypothetical protein